MSFDLAWEKTHSERQWGIEPEPCVVEFIEHNLPIGGRILDLGTGAGAQAFGLAKDGFIIHGVDGSKSAIKRCLERSNGNTNLSFMVGEVTDLPYKDNIFDAAIDCVTFQHLNLEDLRMAIDEVLRVLKPGGRFLSLTAADDYDLSIPSPALVRTMTDNEIMQFYSVFNDLTFAKTSHVSRRGKTVSWWKIEAKTPLA